MLRGAAFARRSSVGHDGDIVGAARARQMRQNVGGPVQLQGAPARPLVVLVKTHSGWVYVAFIIDVFCRVVVGWQASRSLRSDLAIDALEMASFNRRRAGADLSALVHHSDRGVHYLSVPYSQRLADNDIVASVGSEGDSFDGALAESFNGLYKWELIYPRGPWRGLDDVEFATLTYVDWSRYAGDPTASSNPAPGSRPPPPSKPPTTVSPSRRADTAGTQ